MKDPSVLEAAARDAYIWGYPLVVMHRTRALHCSRVPLGTLNHVDRLATPLDRSVVAPNNDTLYSSGWFDLSCGDVTIEVPPIDRYWSVMVLDAFTYVSYVCRRLHGTDGVTVRLTLDPATEPPREAVDVLPVGTPTVWILVRTLVDGPGDLDAASAVQHRIAVTAPPGHPDRTTERIGRPNQVHTAGPAFYAELAAALEVDHPASWHAPPSPEVTDLVSRWREVDEQVLATGVELGEAVVAANPLASNLIEHGWRTNRNGSDFGDDVVRRASTAKYGLAAHHPVENRSYIAQTDLSGARLDGDRPLRLQFPAGEPPCDGFWSLTVYGPDMFLVENEIDRYAVGDRTPGLVRADDGSLPITVGGRRPDDPDNWLPAPSGPFVLALRVYEGHPEVVDATWFPPALEPLTP